MSLGSRRGSGVPSVNGGGGRGSGGGGASNADGMYHAHHGAMNVADEYKQVLQLRDLAAKRERERADVDGRALKKMIDSRLKRAESNRGGDGDIYSESTLDLMPLFEGSTPKSKQRARIDALIKHSKVGTTRDSMRRASLTELCDTKEHYLEMSATIFEGLDFDENVATVGSSLANVAIKLTGGTSSDNGLTRCLVERMPLFEEHGILRDTQANVNVLGRHYTCRLVLTSESIYFSLPARTTKDGFMDVSDTFTRIQGDVIPLHEVVRCQRIRKDTGAFQVEAVEGGFNSGMVYDIGVNIDEVTDWVTDIRQLAFKATEEKERFLPKLQIRIRRIYSSTPCQMFIALLITANFVTVALGSQLQPKEGTPLWTTLNSVDLAFLIFFTFELAVNMFSLWFFPFWRDGWNIFDFFVIVVCLIAEGLSEINIPGLTVLRTSRAFRIMRLAGKLKSLKRIVQALTSSIIPVSNAFLILLTAGCIFSVLGVEFFGDRSKEGFGTFARSAYTIWMLMAFGDWHDSVLPVFRESDGTIDVSVLLYIVMLVFVMLWVLLQVVVALLLDNFVQSKAKNDVEDEANKLQKAELEGNSALQPLIKSFLTTFDTADQLDLGIKRLFVLLDVGFQGHLCFDKMRVGLKKLKCRPRILLTVEDWQEIIKGNNHASYLDGEGNMSLLQFHDMMVHQVKHYIQRGLTDIMAMNAHSIENHAILAGLRLLLLPRGGGVEEDVLIDEIEGKLDDLEDLVKAQYGGFNAPNSNGSCLPVALRPPPPPSVNALQRGSPSASVAPGSPRSVLFSPTLSFFEGKEISPLTVNPAPAMLPSASAKRDLSGSDATLSLVVADVINGGGAGPMGLVTVQEQQSLRNMDVWSKSLLSLDRHVNIVALGSRLDGPPPSSDPQGNGHADVPPQPASVVADRGNGCGDVAALGGGECTRLGRVGGNEGSGRGVVGVGEGGLPEVQKPPPMPSSRLLGVIITAVSSPTRDCGPKTPVE